MADFLDTDDASDPWAISPSEEQAPEVTQEPEQVVETQVEQPVEEQAPEEQTPVEEKFNPTLYREMKEERAKRQAAERELEQLRANAPKSVQQPRQEIPDAYEDKAGFDAYIQNQIETVRWQARAEADGFAAEQIHGKEKVEAAIAWAQAEGAKDPSLGIKVQSQARPVQFVVEQYERSRTLQTLNGKTPEDFAREYAASQGWIVSEPGAQAPILKPSSPMPPKGLATAPGKGGVGQAPSGADWSEVKFALG
jgi:hypothetical protein